MASLELVTNLKLINGTARTTIPTTTELPVGYMCFGIVNGRASIWGNYNDSVVDLVRAGQVTVTIVQSTGTSTTAVISQKGVTDALAVIDAKIGSVESSLGTAASCDVGTASGNVPILDANGKLAEGVIPAVALVDTFVVASQSAMLSLDAQKGDVAIRTDQNRSYILQSTPASTLANWKELLTPTDAVTSVNGKTGTVILTGADIATTFTAATSRTNVVTGDTLQTMAGKIAKWFSDLKALAFKAQIVATTDISGVVPAANLPKGTTSAPGIVSAGNGLTSTSAGVMSAVAGTGIKVDASGISADVVLKIATI